jgi:XTP/dITP diphosphohydrolase
LKKREHITQKNLYFATGNLHKFQEARLILSEYGIQISRLDSKDYEIQAEDVSSIAMTSAVHIANQLGTPVIVEDSGLFIRALNGFPGPYSSYVNLTIGNRGIISLLNGVSKRAAEFKAAVAFVGLDKTKCFLGVTHGRIAFREQGSGGFGYDPIFLPSEGKGKTFAEMSIREKNLFSHRYKALRKFADWYSSMIKSLP